MADLFLTPYVRSVWRMLGYRLTRSGNMCLFGAGEHTRWLLSVTEDLPSLPIECIIDDDRAGESLGGIAIRAPAEVEIDAVDLILVSSDRWEQELVARCRTLWGEAVEVVRLYEGMPAGPYDKSDDRAEALRALRDVSLRELVNSRQVVIVADTPRAREGKIGHALTHAGWDPILLCRQPPGFDAAGRFASVHTYGNEWEALRKACAYSPVAYHIMVNGDYRLAERFLRSRPGPVVVDSYDVVAGMVTDEFLAANSDFVDQIERERFCLEQADGVCCRSQEVDWLESELGYRPGRRLLFLDGCWNMKLPPRKSVHDGTLHAVYAGHMPVETARRAGTLGHESKLWLARILAEQGIHFHLYPWGELRGQAFDDAYRTYRDFEQVTACFHLHRPTAPDRLIEELARYDVALFTYNECVRKADTIPHHTEDKFRVGTANKLFDFIDAGLPVVHTRVEGSLISALLDRFAIQVDVCDVRPEEWGALLRGLDLRDLRARVHTAREYYDVRNHVEQLTEFYDHVRADFVASLDGSAGCNKEVGNENSRDERRQVVV